MKNCEIHFIGVNYELLAAVSQLSEFYRFNEQRPDQTIQLLSSYTGKSRWHEIPWLAFVSKYKSQEIQDSMLKTCMYIFHIVANRIAGFCDLSGGDILPTGLVLKDIAVCHQMLAKTILANKN